jgi:hypothetical protein
MQFLSFAEEKLGNLLTIREHMPRQRCKSFHAGTLYPKVLAVFGI